MKKILVIDDEKDFCFFIKKNLELIGDYEVITAPEGKEGIRLAEKQKPALVLLDIMMPGMDGFEALKTLKKNKNTESIPVIMLTARGDDKARVKSLKLGNDGYIVKPFEISELEDKIEDVLDKSK